MELTQASAPRAPQGPALSEPTTPSTALTSDYEMFLQMLTTQMTNQDPLNPVDSSDYAVQLATFSSVEQQVLTNQLLSDLTTQLGSSGLADLAGYVGKEVRTKAPVYFDGTPIELLTDIAPGADAASLSVRDESGTLIQEFDLGTDGGRVMWAGKDESGAQFPAGVYSFEITSMEGDDVLSQGPAGTYAKILEAQTTSSGLELILKGGIVIAPQDVVAMRT